MIETAMVFDHAGRVLAWHRPVASTGVSIPDSRTFWDVLWDVRAALGGVAHSHPWAGDAHASSEDLTTFSANDRALGRSLIWSVVSMTDVTYYRQRNGQYVVDDPPPFCDARHWSEAIKQLREVSRGRRSLDPDELRAT